MQKTRLGISVGMLGAALFFSCFFSGYVAALILAGYILLFEENAWLKKSAVKGVALMFGFSLISAVVYLLPNIVTFIDSILSIFGGNFYLAFISNLANMLDNAFNLLEKILFIILGLKSFNQGTVRIPVIDSLVSKYMD